MSLPITLHGINGSRQSSLEVTPENTPPPQHTIKKVMNAWGNREGIPLGAEAAISHHEMLFGQRYNTNFPDA